MVCELYVSKVLFILQIIDCVLYYTDNYKYWIIDCPVFACYSLQEKSRQLSGCVSFTELQLCLLVYVFLQLLLWNNSTVE